MLTKQHLSDSSASRSAMCRLHPGRNLTSLPTGAPTTTQRTRVNVLETGVDTTRDSYSAFPWSSCDTLDSVRSYAAVLSTQHYERSDSSHAEYKYLSDRCLRHNYTASSFVWHSDTIILRRALSDTRNKYLRHGHTESCFVRHSLTQLHCVTPCPTLFDTTTLRHALSDTLWHNYTASRLVRHSLTQLHCITPCPTLFDTTTLRHALSATLWHNYTASRLVRHSLTQLHCVTRCPTLAYYRLCLVIPTKIVPPLLYPHNVCVEHTAPY